MQVTAEELLLPRSYRPEVICQTEHLFSFHVLRCRNNRQILKALHCINLREFIFWGAGSRKRQRHQVSLTSYTYNRAV